MRRWRSAEYGSGYSHNATTADRRPLTNQPAFGANRLRSASDANGNQPSVNSDDDRTISEISEDPNVPNTNGNQPTSNGNGPQPSSSGNGPQPSSNGNGHQPTSNGNGHQPTFNENVHYPILHEYRHQPTSGGNGHQPTSNGDNHRPTSNRHNQTPQPPEEEGLIGKNIVNFHLRENRFLSHVDEDGKPLRARLGGIVVDSSVTDSPMSLIRRLEQEIARGRAVCLEMGKLVFVGKAEWVKRALELGGSMRE